MSDDEVMTVERWDDLWWEIWVDAKRTMSGEQAAAHAEQQMTASVGPRPHQDVITLPAGTVIFTSGRQALDPVDTARASEKQWARRLELDRQWVDGPAAARPITVDDVARVYDVPRELLDTSLEPAPPSQRGWLRRVLDRLVG